MRGRCRRRPRLLLTRSLFATLRARAALHWNTEECSVPQNGGNWSGTLPYDPSADYHLYSVVWDDVT